MPRPLHPRARCIVLPRYRSLEQWGHTVPGFPHRFPHHPPGREGRLHYCHRMEPPVSMEHHKSRLLLDCNPCRKWHTSLHLQNHRPHFRIPGHRNRSQTFRNTLRPDTRHLSCTHLRRRSSRCYRRSNTLRPHRRGRRYTGFRHHN